MSRRRDEAPRANRIRLGQAMPVSRDSCAIETPPSRIALRRTAVMVALAMYKMLQVGRARRQAVSRRPAVCDPGVYGRRRGLTCVVRAALTPPASRPWGCHVIRVQSLVGQGGVV